MSEGPERVGGFDVDPGLEAGLCSVLGAAYQLDGNHSRAREVLERALRIWKGKEEGEREKGEAERSLQATDISLKLGSSYRWVVFSCGSVLVQFHHLCFHYSWTSSTIIFWQNF